MGFKKIVAPSIKELFEKQMKEMILSGELAPGDRLPTERELSETMGISKTIVHDGIARLVKMGFLDVKSRKGVYVADFATTGNIETLLAMIEFRGGIPDARIIASLLDMRIYLECPAMRKLAASHTDEDMAVLKKLLDEAADRRPSVSAFTVALFEFHRTIAVLSSNAIIPLIMNAFFNASVPSWELFCSHFGTQASYELLSALYTAIGQGDADSACSIFERSISSYRDYLKEHKN